MSLVVDASVTLAWLFRDESTTETDKILDRVVESGAAVPTIWRLEIANALRSGVRWGRIDTAYRNASIARLRSMPIKDDDAGHLHVWSSVLSLSDRFDLTPYDASYLELAIRLGEEFASCDAKLISAAKSLGLKTLPH